MGKRNDTIHTDTDEIASLIDRVERGELGEEDRHKLGRMLKLLLTLISVVEQKNLSIKRLKRLIFGPGSDKRSAAGTQPRGETADELSGGTAAEATPEDKPKRGGNGRLGAEAYRGARRVACSDTELGPGARCPKLGCEGTLYDTSRPAIFVRLTGKPLVDATIYEQQVLRCGDCQDRVTAPLPEGVRPQKYDATADAAIALARYGAGLPLTRLRGLQESFGIPLPESTQWERIEALADAAHPVFLSLEREAAQGDVVWADDTKARILSCMAEDHKGDGDGRATRTTGIVSRVDGRRIVLYRTSRDHAGDNLRRLFDKREPGREAPVQSGDALAHNWCHGFEVIVAKCLAHARRKFVDIEPVFPEHCRRVFDDFAFVWKQDEATKDMTAEQRLAWHKRHSGAVIEGLYTWIDEQLASREVEPNSALGKAFKYLKKHREGLTQFLRDGRAPLDSNLVERALKRVVLSRKNSLFYRTEHGAAVGDLLTSLIETSRSNQTDAFEYLVALSRNARAVRAAPEAWLPWTYQETLGRRGVA